MDKEVDVIRKDERQSSFTDADYLCDALIPQNSFYRKFKELVTPLIKDEHFEDLYCKDNGRPATSPALLACACILQCYLDYSDREIEDACTWDLRVKHALGLDVSEHPFDHSTIQAFRYRLLEHSREREIFDRILKHLIEKKLIKKHEVQRIDATHVIADIAVPSTIRLVRRGIFEALKMLKGRRKDIWDEIAKEIKISEYHKKKVNKDLPGNVDGAIRKRKLVEVVTDARIVLKHIENLELGEAFKYRVGMLKDILNENVKEEENGKVRELKSEEKPKDILVSPIDPDARFGAKSKTHKFVGYKANITETVKSRFITNIVAIPGNAYDGGESAVQLIAEQKSFGLAPEKLIGDSAYGSGENRRNVGGYGTQMVAPNFERKTGTIKAIIPKKRFKYDEESETVTCPKGAVSEEYWYDKKRSIKVFHFPEEDCAVCPWQERCTTNDEKTRTISIGMYHKELTESDKYNKTKEYKKLMKLRPMIEGTNSEVKNLHGMRRTRYRGRVKVGLQFFFTAAAVNIKRWINGILEKIKPKKKRLAYVT
jgi:transposase